MVNSVYAGHRNVCVQKKNVKQFHKFFKGAMACVLSWLRIIPVLFSVDVQFHLRVPF